MYRPPDIFHLAFASRLFLLYGTSVRSVDLSEKGTTVLNMKLIGKKGVNIFVTLRNFHCFSSSTGCTQRKLC